MYRAMVLSQCGTVKVELEQFEVQRRPPCSLEPWWLFYFCHIGNSTFDKF